MMKPLGAGPLYLDSTYAVNSRMNKKGIYEEGVFHETREAYWSAQTWKDGTPITRRQAHVIASMEQRLNPEFITDCGLTAYDNLQLNGMNNEDREKIITEYEKVREWHHSTLQRAIGEFPGRIRIKDLQQAKDYEYKVWLEASLLQRHFIYRGPFKDTLIVKRNNVPGLSKKQVKLRLCEFSELTDNERDKVSTALHGWSGSQKMRDVIHIDYLNMLIKGLRENDIMSGARFTGRDISRIYFAISKPEDNGTKNIDVEAFVVISEQGDDRSVVTCWEIRPANRTKKILLSEEEKDVTAKDVRFIGVGHQILIGVLLRELRLGFAYDSESDLYHISTQLEKEGLKANRSYSYKEVIGAIQARSIMTYKLLEDEAIAEGGGADDILKELAEEILGLAIMWTGNYIKPGFRVACTRIEDSRFSNNTYKIAKITEDMSKLGKHKADQVVFLERITDASRDPDGDLRKRRESLQAVADRTGVAISYYTYECSKKPAANCNTIIPRENVYDKAPFTKTAFDIRRKDGEYIIALDGTEHRLPDKDTILIVDPPPGPHRAKSV
ncbi:MAG: hypothetical protein JW800_05675 [Candidatus Omnitrophica bacterium]|nr:hypothetical protein [Candidatus Omnitrophota bacterium]